MPDQAHAARFRLACPCAWRHVRRFPTMPASGATRSARARHRPSPAELEIKTEQHPYRVKFQEGFRSLKYAKPERVLSDFAAMAKLREPMEPGFPQGSQRLMRSAITARVVASLGTERSLCMSLFHHHWMW